MMSLSSTQNVLKHDQFEELLASVMDSLATRAVNSESAKKFATKEENLTNW